MLVTRRAVGRGLAGLTGLALVGASWRPGGAMAGTSDVATALQAALSEHARRIGGGITLTVLGVDRAVDPGGAIRLAARVRMDWPPGFRQWVVTVSAPDLLRARDGAVAAVVADVALARRPLGAARTVVRSA